MDSDGAVLERTRSTSKTIDGQLELRKLSELIHIGSGMNHRSFYGAKHMRLHHVAVHSLVDDGYVERVGDTSPRARMLFYGLTPKGIELYDAVVSAYDENR